MKEGITTNELDELAYKFIVSKGAIPAFQDEGFPKTICTSINQEAVHGIPSDRFLRNGDIISIDIGVNYNGYYGDGCWTYPIGDVSDNKKYLLVYGEKCLYAGLSVIKDGIKIKEIGNAISKYATIHGLTVISGLTGHGIGEHLHENPVILHTINDDETVLHEGMTICIEPVIMSGPSDTFLKEDNWTIETCERNSCVHFEHTILVKKNGIEILTGGKNG